MLPFAGEHQHSLIGAKSWQLTFIAAFILLSTLALPITASAQSRSQGRSSSSLRPSVTATSPLTVKSSPVKGSPNPLTGATNVTIYSTTGWQPTGLTVQQGTQYTIYYTSGTWTVDVRNFPSVGPQGYLWDEDQKIAQGCKYDPTLTYATLLGQIGNGSDFVVGKGGVYIAGASGSLSLRINDQDACLGDNSGFIKLTLKGTASGTDLNVDGTQPWTDTGVNLSSGSTVYMRADGIVWMASGPAVPYNPDGLSTCKAGQGSPGPGLYCYSLVGRIGNGKPFQLGSISSFSVSTSGRLYLGVNDNVFSDNSGSWFATIIIPITSTDPGWAGYKVYGPDPYTMTFSDVAGSWKQPAAKTCASNEASEAVFWVGLGGGLPHSKTLVQIGTQITCIGGKVENHPWFEVLPKQGSIQYIDQIDPQDTVSTHDQVNAKVMFKGHNLFLLEIEDITRHWTFSTLETQVGTEKNSAEWITEAPIAGGSRAPFTDFGSVIFFSCTVDGLPISSSAPIVNEVTLHNSIDKATPSDLITSGNAFTVRWLHQ